MARSTQSPVHHRQVKAVAVADELLDMDQAIAALATTRPTFYRWLRAGTVKGVKLGRQWRFRREDIERCQRGEGPRIDLPMDIKRLISELRERLDEAKAENSGDLIELAVQLAFRLVLRLNASDLHLLAFANAAALQLRIDGALVEVSRFDARLLPLVIERIKRMTGIDPGNVTQAQHGTLRMQHDGQNYDVMATSLPTSHGECMVVRFHDQSLRLPTMDQLGLGKREQALLERALKAPRGLVLFTGPTGSGKTTTMYACAQRSAQPDARMITVEIHMPFHLPDAIRVRVDAEHGMDYPAALRAVMQMDPDILIVENLRDRETMAAAAECSMTGHLVLGCLAGTDTIAALRRVAELSSDLDAGVEEVSVIVAQRLVRRLCHCATSATLPLATSRRAELLAGGGGVPWSSLTPTWKRATGCSDCRDSGFSGRVMIHEILEVTSELRSSLRRGSSDADLRTIALGQGLVSLAADGIRTAAAGQTTIDELLHVLPDLGTPPG